jgi:hypothetical protein
MPHRLQIKLTVDPAIPTDVKTLVANQLSGSDAIRGIPCSFNLSVKNLGPTQFPGGVFKKVLLVYPEGVSQNAAMPDVGAIAAGATTELPPLILIPLNHGASTIQVVLESLDQQPVEYFQRQLETALSGGQWVDIFYVADREQINLILALAKRG